MQQKGVPAAGLLAPDGQPVREEVDDERGDEDVEDVEYAEVPYPNAPWPSPISRLSCEASQHGISLALK